MLNLDLSKISDFYTREVFRQLLAATTNTNGTVGPRGATGATGEQGLPGESFVNIDGGTPFSTYGGVNSLDGGGVV